MQRWVKFSKYLPEWDWQPVIYTPLNPEQLAHDESLLHDIPQCAEIIKTHINEPYEIYRKLTGAKGPSEVNPVNAGKKSLIKRLSLWIRGNCFIPDPRVSWVKPSVRFLRKYLKEHPVDAVITTGPPQSMHLIGLGLKKSLGVKWVADFRDPWTEMFYYKHLGLSKASDKKHHKQEKLVLDHADRVIAVSPPVRDDFQAKTTTKVELITNGWDEDDFAQEVQKRDDGKFRIVHTGLFAADGNPLKLWDALAELCTADSGFAQKMEIRLAGKTDSEIVKAIEARGLGESLINLGYLPHEKVVVEQNQADLLILPLRQEPEYAKVLPGKIFEYLASGRPVLGIGQTGSASGQILQDAAAGEMFDWNDKFGMKNFVIATLANSMAHDVPDHCEPKKQARQSPSRANNRAKHYSRRVLCEELVKLLLSL